MSVLLVLALLLAAVVVHDLVQRRHSIIRNFPLIGHLRYMLETFGPELRQYIVTSNNEERPFNRDQRRWVYTSAKQQNSNVGFGSDNEMDQTAGYLLVKPAVFPYPSPQDGSPGAPPLHELPAGKVIGAARGRLFAFRPASVVNISGMSFGALSANAVEALNRGAALAGCLQSTGEGGLSHHHRNGGELVFQIGTGYFGCRDGSGRFSLDELGHTLAGNPVRAIEIKLSQGAKPGLGGVLPAAKVTREIAAIRGVPAGRQCVSPPRHSAFGGVDSLLDFVEMLAAHTGLPVGIKAAVGQPGFWEDLADAMRDGERGVDFIVIDGGEGGSGSAPLAFSDHVALPFKLAFADVYARFARRGIADRVFWVGSGKLGFPEAALTAMALGCDGINVGREAMLAIGCIQAQRCHTGRCPAGVATQSRWLMHGLDPDLKAARCANYIVRLRAELAALARTCGVPHPALVAPDQLEFILEPFKRATVAELFGYEPDWRSSSPQVETELEVSQPSDVIAH